MIMEPIRAFPASSSSSSSPSSSPSSSSSSPSSPSSLGRGEGRRGRQVPATMGSSLSEIPWPSSLAIRLTSSQAKMVDDVVEEGENKATAGSGQNGCPLETMVNCRSIPTIVSSRRRRLDAVSLNHTNDGYGDMLQDDGPVNGEAREGDNVLDSGYNNNDREMKAFGSYYKIEKLGSGSFGVVFKGIHADTNEAVAIKRELSTTKFPTLAKESQILKGLQGLLGIPKWINFGCNGTDTILMMELLGPSLKDLLVVCRGKMTIKTVHMLGIQLLSCLEGIHYRNIIHRDIKPSNIVIGVGESSIYPYLIDFGLAKSFRHPVTLEHVPSQKNKSKSIIGTTRFAPIASHRGDELGRKDDLESLVYTLIYLLKGCLPWQTLGSTKSNSNQAIEKMKSKMLLSDLCHGLPTVFLKLLIYTKTLKMEDLPDYSYLKQIFIRSMRDWGISFDYNYDWMNDTTSPATTTIMTPNNNDHHFIDPSIMVPRTIETLQDAATFLSPPFNDWKKQFELYGANTAQPSICRPEAQKTYRTSYPSANSGYLCPPGFRANETFNRNHYQLSPIIHSDLTSFSQSPLPYTPQFSSFNASPGCYCTDNPNAQQCHQCYIRQTQKYLP